MQSNNTTTTAAPIQRPLSVQRISGEVCGQCKFAKSLPPNVQGNEAVQKLCKRMPPQVTSFIVGVQKNGMPQIIDHRAWPGVGDHDEGCGEFKQKITLT